MKACILSKRLIHRNRIYSLYRYHLKVPGHARMWRDTVEHPGAVTIIPLLPGNRLVLIRQYRFAAGGMLWEFPAGTLERGENPKACAGRELIEEAGYRARRIEKLGVFFTAPGFCNERMHLFLARDLSPASAPSDADEIIRPRVFPFRRVLRMAERGLIADGKSLAGLFLAARRLGIDRNAQ